MIEESPTIFPSHLTNEDSCVVDRHYNVQASIMSGTIILFGIIFLLYGYRLFKFVLFLIGFWVGFLSIYVICSLYMNDVLKTDIQHKPLIYLGVSAGGGFMLGLLSVCCFYIGLVFLGASLGWFSGMAVLPVIVSLSSYVANHSWVAYTILFLFALIGAVLILIMQKMIIVISTSFLGAYGIMQGLDYFVEKGKVLFYILEILYNGQTKYLPKCWFTWFVLAWIPCLFILGLFIQYKVTGKNYDHRTGYQRPNTLVVIPVDTQELDQISTQDDQPLLTSYA